MIPGLLGYGALLANLTLVPHPFAGALLGALAWRCHRHAIRIPA